MQSRRARGEAQRRRERRRRHAVGRRETAAVASARLRDRARPPEAPDGPPSRPRRTTPAPAARSRPAGRGTRRSRCPSTGASAPRGWTAAPTAPTQRPAPRPGRDHGRPRGRTSERRSQASSGGEVRCCAANAGRGDVPPAVDHRRRDRRRVVARHVLRCPRRRHGRAGEQRVVDDDPRRPQACATHRRGEVGYPGRLGVIARGTPSGTGQRRIPAPDEHDRTGRRRGAPTW